MTTYSQFYYISSGAKNKLFTLRISGGAGSRVHDEYIRILGNDWEESVAAAKAYLGDRAYLLKEDFEKDATSILGTIIRDGKQSAPSSAQINIDQLQRGIMPFGKYKGQTLEEIASHDLGYLAYIYINATAEVKAILAPYAEKHAAIKKIEIDAREAKFAEAAALSKHIGAIGDKIIIDAEITFTMVVPNRFSYNGSNLLIVGKDASQNQFKAIYSGSDSFEKGDKLKIKATIKGHGEYKGAAQTTITRIKKVA